MSLSVRGLAYGFPRRVVGRGLDLDVVRGQALCVLGPNGSGKTTLFRTVLGLLPALQGTITLEGRDVRALARAEISRAIAYVPQSSSMAFDFTLEEIVVMGRTAHLGAFAAPGIADLRIARAALERFGLGALAGRPFAEVSGGERQLALIARALATSAGIVVMDEPTATLDFANQARLLAEVARLKREGMGVLFCSHDPSHAFEAADEVLLLQPGGTLAHGRPHEVLTEANLSRLYGLPVEVRDGAARVRGAGLPGHSARL